MKTIAWLAVLAAAQCSLSAASVTWGPVQTETGNASDIFTTGTFFDSATTLAGDPTINGVTFNSANSSSTFDNGSQIQLLNSAGVFLGNPAPGTYVSGYQAMASQGALGIDTTIQLGGLTAGKTYQFEILEPFWDHNFASTWSDGVNNSGALQIGTGFGNPDYVMGTFTADSTGIQDISSFDNDPPFPPYTIFSGIEVRTSVPDSSATLPLLGLSLAGLMVLARSRRFTA